MSVKRRFAQTIQMAVSAPIPNAGTLVFPYPTGEAQTSAWDGAGHTLVDGAGNLYSSGFSVAFGASTITLTNSSLGTIPTNTKLRLNLRKFSFLNADVLFDPNAALLDKIAVARVLGLPVVLGMSAVAVSCPADTNEDALATVTVAANAMGLNGRVRVTSQWTFAGAGGNKTPRVRFGGAGGTAYVATALNNANTVVKLVTEFANRGAANSQHGGTVIHNNDPALGYVPTATTGAIDSSAASSVYISGQKAAGADTLTLESYLVELYPG